MPYYRVVRECEFDGVKYQVGQVINRADPEICARLLREVGHAVILTDDSLPTVVAAPVEPVAELQPAPRKRKARG